MSEPNKGIPSIFLASDGRLSLAWRLLLYLFLVSLFSLVLGSLFALAYSVATGDPSLLTGEVLSLDTPAALVQEGAALVAITLATLISRIVFDRRSFGSLGVTIRPGWLSLASIGFAIGAAQMTFVFVVQWAFGWVVVLGPTWNAPPSSSALWTATAISFVVFVFGAWNEELMDRGYLLQNTMESWGVVPAVLAVSAFFGALHLGNPNVTLLAVLNIAAAGILYALGYLLTGSLWLPIGMHLAWNFFEGPVFGFPVSGLSTSSLLLTQSVGPTIVTGGAFGPEAGVLDVTTSVMGIAVLWAIRRRLPGRPVEALREHVGEG